MAIIKPELGDFFPVGLETIYVVEVEGVGWGDRATKITGHDDNGNEVEVTGYMLDAGEYDAEYGTNYSGDNSDHEDDEDNTEPDPWPYKHQDL